MKPPGKLLIYSLLIFLCPGYVHARSIYKWTDAEGNVHYGEKPPAGGATEVRIRDRGGVEPVEAQPDSSRRVKQTDAKVQRDKMIKAMEGDRLARQAQKLKKKDQQDNLNRQCVQARDTLRRYRRATSLYRLDKEGNRKAVPEAVKQQETTRLQAEIKKWCK